MNKGGRKTRYNLRQKFQALSSSSGKKKSKHSTKHKKCTCPSEYFDLATGICGCTCHVHDNTALSSHQRVSPSILDQHPTSQFATQAGQASPSSSYLATQTEQTSSPSHFATQAGQTSPSTSPLATQAGHVSPSTSHFAIPTGQASLFTTPFATQAGQTSPFPSYLVTQAGQASPFTSQFKTQAAQTSPIPSYLATQAAQLSPSTSQFATQAGPPSPPASPLTSLSVLSASNPPDQLPEQSPPLDSTPDLTDTSDSESETDNEDETTPLLSLPLRKTKSLSLTDKTKPQDSSDKEDKEYIRPCSRNPSKEAIFQVSTMHSGEYSDLQREMINLQRQICHQLELTQASMSTPHVTESTVVKPTLFHGRENENIDRWLQRFALYLANCKISPTSDQAAIKLALHLSGPAETFYYNLPNTVQASYTLLKDALTERFSPAHRHLRNRQELSKRRQGPNESLESFLADLNEKFNCLDLRDEDKLCYLIQGLRTDIQAEVLKKEPKTYTEAEEAARLIYSIQQSVFQRRQEDITHLVHTANHPQPTTPHSVPVPSQGETSLLTGIQSLLNKSTSPEQHKLELLAKELHRHTSQKVAAPSSLETQLATYQSTPQARTDDLFHSLQAQIQHLNEKLSGHPSVAAYQCTTPREPSHRNSDTDELSRLREENRQLKATQRASLPQRHQSTDLSRVFNEIRRLQSRMDGFMRVYATRNYQQHPSRARTHDGRPICHTCGKIGHVKAVCFQRFDTSPSYRQPQHIPSASQHQGEEPHIAVYEQQPVSAELSPSGQSSQVTQADPTYSTRPSQTISSSPSNAEVASISTFEASTSQHSTNNKSLSAHNIESKSDPATLSECCTPSALHANDATAMVVNDKQEIVIRLEIHTDQKPPTSPEQAPMHSVTLENSEKHQLEPTITEINHPFTDQTIRLLGDAQRNSSEPRRGTSSYKQEQAIKPQINVHPQSKQPTQESFTTRTRRQNLPLPTASESRQSHSQPHFHAGSNQQSNAFVRGNIHGCPVDLLVDTGACISVINASFLREILCAEDPPVMAPSTYSHVDTVNGAKLSTIGQIQVLLSLNGRNFPCQFHVIEDMSHYAVLGRDFLLAHDAIIHFTSGTLTLDNAFPVELPLNAETLRPMTNLLVPTNLSYNRENDEQSTSVVTQLTGPSHRCFVQTCKKASSLLLKFLHILLLMSPHGHATWANDTLSLAKDLSPLTAENSSLRPTSIFNKPREHLSVSSHFIFRLSHVRLKNFSSNTAVTPITVCNTLLQEIQVNPPDSNHSKRSIHEHAPAIRDH